MENVEISDNPNFINIYPNPTIWKFNVDLGGSGADRISLYDAQGKLVYDNSSNLAGTLTIDLVSFSKGLYFMNVQKSGVLTTKKIILE